MKLFQAIGSVFKGIGNAIWSAYHWLIGRHLHYHLQDGSCCNKKEYFKEQAELRYKKSFTHLRQLEEFYKNDISDKHAHYNSVSRTISNQKKELLEEAKYSVDDSLNRFIDGELEKLGLFKGPIDLIKEYLIEFKADDKPKKGR